MVKGTQLPGPEEARILGIETSCDETAASIVENGRVILSNTVASQVDLHAQRRAFGRDARMQDLRRGDRRNRLRA